MGLKPLLYTLLNPWPATFQKLPERRAVHVESIKRKTFGKLFNIHCRWLQPTANHQLTIAALAALLYPQPLEPVAILFYEIINHHQNFLQVQLHIHSDLEYRRMPIFPIHTH